MFEWVFLFVWLSLSLLAVSGTRTHTNYLCYKSLPNSWNMHLMYGWMGQNSYQKVNSAIKEAVLPLSTYSWILFQETYAKITSGNPNWNKLSAPTSTLYPWDASSTYIRHPPFFKVIMSLKHHLLYIQESPIFRTWLLIFLRNDLSG